MSPQRPWGLTGFPECPGQAAWTRGGNDPVVAWGTLSTPSPLQAVIADSEYHHFRYRIPPGRVRALEVGGDLQLELVKIF